MRQFDPETGSRLLAPSSPPRLTDTRTGVSVRPLSGAAMEIIQEHAAEYGPSGSHNLRPAWTWAKVHDEPPHASWRYGRNRRCGRCGKRDAEIAGVGRAARIK